MKRRIAIKNIAAYSIAVSFLPSCNMEEIPFYENLQLEKEQYKLLSELSEFILPKKETEIFTPEKTVDFILTIINDCYSPDEIEKYKKGLIEFQNTSQENYNSTFQRLNAIQRTELIEKIRDMELSASYFFSITKDLTKEHFTTSEYFMKKYRDFEFAPGRYLGSVEI